MSKNVPQGPSIQLSIGIIIVTAQGYTGTETQAWETQRVKAAVKLVKGV